MTLDTLLSDFDAAVMRAQSMNREELPAWAHRRAGLVAVVRALRDEMASGTAWHALNEILGDAGEKVAGVAALEVAGAGLSPASGQAPATDAAHRPGCPSLVVNECTCDYYTKPTDAAPAVCDIKELVKRLKRTVFRSDDIIVYANPDGVAAADTLEAMAGEVERYRERHKGFMTLQNALERVCGEKAAAEAERDRLKGALEAIAVKAGRSEWSGNYVAAVSLIGDLEQMAQAALRAAGDGR